MADGNMNKTRLEAQERFDLPDVRSLQELAYEYDVAELGALLGLIDVDDELQGGTLYAGGCVTMPALTTTDSHAVVIGPVTLAQIDRPLAGKVAAQVVRSAGGFIDCGSSPGTPWLWFQRQEADGTAATRRKWGSTKEVAYSPNTRTLEAVEFVAAVNRPVAAAGASGWFPWARVTGWDGAEPVIALLSVWDSFSKAGNPGDSYWDASPVLLTSDESYQSLRGLLYRMRIALARQRDSADGTAWTSAPPRGLKQLDADLTALDAEVAEQSGWILWAVATYTYDSGALPFIPRDATFAYTVLPISGTKVGMGHYQFTFDTPIALKQTNRMPHGVVNAPWYVPGRNLTFTLDGAGENAVSCAVRFFDLTGAAKEIIDGEQFSVMIWRV